MLQNHQKRCRDLHCDAGLGALLYGILVACYDRIEAVNGVLRGEDADSSLPREDPAEEGAAEADRGAHNEMLRINRLNGHIQAKVVDDVVHQVVLDQQLHVTLLSAHHGELLREIGSDVVVLRRRSGILIVQEQPVDAVDAEFLQHIPRFRMPDEVVVVAVPNQRERRDDVGLSAMAGYTTLLRRVVVIAERYLLLLGECFVDGVHIAQYVLVSGFWALLDVELALDDISILRPDEIR